MTNKPFMSRSLLAGLGAALIATAASAADLPRKSTPVAPAIRAIPTFTWTGFYAGLNAGYGFGSYSGTATPGFSSPRGFVGGGQVGYNQQIGQFVAGLEADLAYSDIKDKLANVGKERVGYIGTIRGRMGYAVDRFMPYVTGGFAYGGTELLRAAGRASQVQTGWALGAGVEYAVTNNLTARVEGLYVDLTDKRVFGGPQKTGTEVGLIRAGINAKF